MKVRMQVGNEHCVLKAMLLLRKAFWQGLPEIHERFLGMIPLLRHHYFANIAFRMEEWCAEVRRFEQIMARAMEAHHNLPVEQMHKSALRDVLLVSYSFQTIASLRACAICITISWLQCTKWCICHASCLPASEQTCRTYTFSFALILRAAPRHTLAVERRCR